MVDESQEISGEQGQTQSPGEQSPQNTPPPPAKPAQGGGMPDFLSNFTEKLKATPKQNYGPNGPSNESRNPTPGGSDSIQSPGTSAPGSAEPVAQEAIINTDGVDNMKSQAKVWVYMTDLLASRGLAMYSVSGKVDEFKISDSEKLELESALVEYFKTMPETPKLPPWLVLLVAVAMIYGGKFAQANKKRKESKSRKKSATQEAKPEVKTDSKPILVPPRKVEKPVVKIDPSKPYFGQALDSKGRLVINPVSLQKNEQRKEKGGQICLNCGQNHCEPGKNACSPHCSGKLNTKS